VFFLNFGLAYWLIKNVLYFESDIIHLFTACDFWFNQNHISVIKSVGKWIMKLTLRTDN